MSNQPIFPPAEDDGCAPFRAIGDRIGCSEDEVLDAFRGVMVPEWITPAHLDHVKAMTHSLNTAARHATNLCRTLGEIGPDQRELITSSGAPTLQQLEFLRDVLNGDATHLKEWAGNRSRVGGRNPAAHAVAEGMRRLFRRLRKKITFGSRPQGGPSTEFGREIEFAIGAFGIIADWRRPTSDAFDKQIQIANRLMRFEEGRRTRPS